MVIIASPSKYYEIEFFSDGHIEVQTFGSPVVDVMRMTIDEVFEIVTQDVIG